MSAMDRQAAQVVETVAGRCKAVACKFLTDEIRSAVLYRDVLNPVVIRSGDADWLLALGRAVDSYIQSNKGEQR